MKFKTLALSASMLVSGSALATYGTNLIGFGPQSRAMGGTGIALGMGPESALKNPALIATDQKFSFLFAGTYFSPKVKAKNDNFLEKESKADTFMIPSIGFTYKLSNSITFGLGAYGTSGMGVNYLGTDSTGPGVSLEPGLYRMKTSFSSMKFAPAFAWHNDAFKAGVGLSIMYGSMGISYQRGGLRADTDGDGSTVDANGFAAVGSESPGSSDDYGLGWDLGLAYTLKDFTVGFNYQSKIKLNFERQLSDARGDFGIANAELPNDEMSQPAEMGIGVAWEHGAFAATVDFKQVKWEDAEGYKDFGWEDQSLISLGVQYKWRKTSFRLGYMKGDNPLGSRALKNNASTVAGAVPRNAHNMLNIVGFPAITEDHITLGVAHEFSEVVGMDLSFVKASEVSETAQFNQSAVLAADNFLRTYTTTHSQTSITIAGRWKF
jgi:long-chain fatty acid transport protein